MTPYEYRLRLKAYRLKSLDKEYERRRQAWVNQEAKAKKTQGNKEISYWKDFKHFFDYEKQEKEILGKKETALPKEDKEFSRLLLGANS